MNVCQNCHAGCCRSFAVPTTGADILRIERDLGLEFWDFACRWADPHSQIAQKYAPQFHFSDEPGMPYVICLAHVQSEVFPTTTKCRFLVESQPDEEHPLGIGQCGIYDSRPGACRAFPTKFDTTGELAVIYDIPGSGRENESPAYGLCPRPWEPSDVDPLQTLQDLAAAKFEMSFFHSVAMVWNRQPREWNLFPEFLRLVYSNRVIKEESTEATTQAEIVTIADQLKPKQHRAA